MKMTSVGRKVEYLISVLLRLRNLAYRAGFHGLCVEERPYAGGLLGYVEVKD